jgi:hypothetical protein
MLFDICNVERQIKRIFKSALVNGLQIPNSVDSRRMLNRGVGRIANPFDLWFDIANVEQQINEQQINL